MCGCLMCVLNTLFKQDARRDGAVAGIGMHLLVKECIDVI